MTRIYMFGFFGAPNFGDELLCQAIVSNVGRSLGNATRFHIATRQPKVTRRLVRGNFRTVPGLFSDVRFFAFLPWRLWSLAQADRVLIGGGGLFYENSSPRGIMGCTFDATAAILFNRPYDIIGVEIGHIETEGARALVSFVFRNARTIWCRDETTLEKARALCGRDDPQFFADISHDFLEGQVKASSGTQTETHGQCVINPLALHFRKPEEFTALILWAQQRFDRVVVAIAQPGEEKAIAELLKTTAAKPVDFFVSPDWREVMALLRTSDLVIAERFHYVVAGAHARIPVVAIVHTEKVRQLTKQLGIEKHAVELPDATCESISKAASSARRACESRIAKVVASCREGFARLQSTSRESRHSPEIRRMAWIHFRSIMVWGVLQKLRAAWGMLFLRSAH